MNSVRLVARRRWSRWLLAVAFAVAAQSVFAQEAGAAAGGNRPVLHLFGAALGLGMIVIGAALGIGKFAAAAAEGIARQPAAAARSPAP